jgi:hypothetical protein
MPEFENLEELEQYIRTTLPEARSIQHLKRNEGKFIDFFWHQRHFAVRPNLDVFEIKDRKGLFITGASQLIQASLLVKDKNQRVIAAIAETMQRAEDVIRTNREQGLALIASCKNTLSRLIKK